LVNWFALLKSFSYPWLNPNSEIGMGSARGPRAGLGGSPKPSSHFLCPILARESLWDEIFGEPPKTARQRRALPVRLRRTRLRVKRIFYCMDTTEA